MCARGARKGHTQSMQEEGLLFELGVVILQKKQ